jgi:(p)ppGpp synthase/HD superfamily hydrolase
VIKVPTIEVALFVLRAHDNQTRLDGSPYSFHPFRCVENLRNVFGVKSDEDDQGMLLHDVGEDEEYTGFNCNQLIEMFGDPARLAVWLCKSNRTRGTEKLAHNFAYYEKFFSEAPEQVQIWKHSDRLENLSDPQHWPANFRKFYLADTHNYILHAAKSPGVDIIKSRLEFLCSGQ